MAITLAPDTPSDRSPPWLLQIRSSTGFIVATIWMSTFTDFLLYAMIVPVLPSALMARTSISYSEREYWVSVLLMCEAGTALAFCPIFGYLVDKAHTRRLPFLSALILLAGCMVIMHTAHSLAMFIIGRLLQGCAAALVVVASFALLNDSIPPNNLGQAIGYLGSAIALGFLLGPFLGGLVYHSGGYDAVFYVAYTAIAVDFGMRVTLVEKRVAEEWNRYPQSGQMINGIPADPDFNDVDDEPAMYEQSLEAQPRRAEVRVALFEILKKRRVWISSWALLVQGILLSAFDATLSIFVEKHYGWSARGMGMIFFPMAVPAFFEPIFGYITDRWGTRSIAFACFSLLSPTLICLRHTDKDDTANIALLFILLFLIGIFIHACVPAMFVETQQALIAMEDREPGILGSKGAVAQGFGLQSMCQFAGVFLGPLWGGLVEYRFGWGAMSGSLGILAGVSAVPMLWMGGERERGVDEDEGPI